MEMIAEMCACYFDSGDAVSPRTLLNAMATRGLKDDKKEKHDRKKAKTQSAAHVVFEEGYPPKIESDRFSAVPRDKKRR